MQTRNMQVRLAFREEGNFWNAYLALPNTMADAKLVGSISFGPVSRNSQIKNAFMDVMKAVLADAVKDVTGEEVQHFETQPAPESERSGHS